MVRLFKNSSAGSSLLLMLAGLPVVLATIVHFTPARIEAVEDPVPPPALVFQQYMIRPYLPEPQAVVSARFQFINRSDRPVEIGHIERSCGCLGQQLRKTRYEPGERGELMLKVQTANEAPGDKEFYAVVHYTDPHPRTARLTFKFHIPEDKVTVEPKALLFYQFGSDSSSREITIRDHRPQKLKVQEVRCHSPLATVSPVTVTDREDHREYRFTVVVKGDAPPGQHRSLISIFTDDVSYPQVIVPLYVQGPEAEPSGIEVDPSEARLLRATDESPALPIRITKPASKGPLEITAAESSPIGIIVELEPTRIEGELQVVDGRLRLHPDLPRAVHRGVVSIHTANPGQPVLEIPVRIEDATPTE